MKNFVLLSIAVMLLFSCSGKKTGEFKVKGTVKNVETGLIYLQKVDEGSWIKIDSAKITKGEFMFTGSQNVPEMRYLVLKGGHSSVPFFIGNYDIDMKIDLDSVDHSVITGSPEQDIYKKYQAKTTALNEKMDKIYADWKKAKEAGDTATMKTLDAQSSSMDAASKQLIVDFSKENHGSVVAPYLIMKNAWQFDLPELKNVITAYDTTLNSSIYLQALKRRIEILQHVEIGQVAPDITLNDSTGKPVSLSSLKGKIVLVDFWASWCAPCRAENPNVVKAYQAFHAKGFDVLGVSFDTNRDRWLKAVKDDHLTWNHMSDLKGWGNAAGKVYGIMSIPANVLLDKDQKIIGKNLKGEDLQKKLAELLGEPAKAPGKKK